MLRFVLLLGLLALLNSGAPAAAAGMTFHVVTQKDCTKACARAVIGIGPITGDTARYFHQFSGGLGSGLPVILHSPGGDVVGALRLGTVLRLRGSTVVLPKGSVCASACVLAMLGGRSRVVEAGALVAVHKWAGVRRALTPREDLAFARDLERYARSMGADPALIAVTSAVPNTSARPLSSREFARYRVATSVIPSETWRNALPRSRAARKPRPKR